mgnify:CR=1 FL=1
MIFTKTKIQGLYIIEPEPKIDKRGYFQRVYDATEFKKNGINFKIVQANQSMSFKKGLIRGIHMQKPPKSEDKLIQCISGSIFDVTIDLRLNSKTYGQWFGTTLLVNKGMIYIPKGCAHGFQALENNTIVQYPVSAYYSLEYEIGIRWNDQFFNIKWPVKKVALSKKDSNWPDFTASIKE